jgi:alanyl-tRNA synthetase
VRFIDKLELSKESIFALAKLVVDNFSYAYPNLESQEAEILTAIKDEEGKFRKTLESGLKYFENVIRTYINGNLTGEILPGSIAFLLYTTYGFPVELITEEAKSRGLSINMVTFEQEMKKHQDLSRIGSEHKFKGGLGGTGEVELRYHTATHLLHQALRDVLGNNVQQKGSNITAERLRFDFVHSAKMTDDEKKRVEDIVNEKIMEKLPMNKVILPKAEAEKTGALHFFGDKYGDEVSVYYIGDSIEDAYSKEFCGGPHVKNTSELGHFKIVKEEAVSAGVRRIKAVLE